MMAAMNTPKEKSHKIVIVDDEEKLLLGLKAVMRRAGYEVAAAKNGSDALQLIQEAEPDLIICDVMMPQPNGFQLKKMLAEQPRCAEIPFIFLTARTGDADKIAGLNMGADDYITKPFNVDELLGHVQAILRRREIERQKAAREFEAKLDQMRHSVASNLSHELRTPLGVILAGLELALREKFAGNTANLDWYLKSSLESANHLSLLVNDLIILSDIDQGKLNKLRTPVNLRFRFLDPIQKIRAYYAEKNLELNIFIEDGVEVCAPEVEFSVMVSHLVDNACKFSPPGGRVTVQLTRRGKGGCTLRVSDEGPGIPPELREKVFERYYQIDHGDTRSYGGLGVGLTIARAIAESAGGRLAILDAATGCEALLEYPPSAPHAVLIAATSSSQAS